MELRQLRYFLGVCEAGSLLKASARLHIAQPALGQQMAALEEELGVKLFARSTRGMALTPEGRVFLEHAKVVLTDADRAKEAVRHSATEPQGQVVLGLPTTVALAAKLKHWQLEADDVALVIGGPDGLDPEFKKLAHERIRLSDLTLPHAMVRVLLIEQLYRAWSVNANHPYHRE